MYWKRITFNVLDSCSFVAKKYGKTCEKMNKGKTLNRARE